MWSQLPRCTVSGGLNFFRLYRGGSRCHAVHVLLQTPVLLPPPRRTDTARDLRAAALRPDTPQVTRGRPGSTCLPACPPARRGPHACQMERKLADVVMISKAKLKILIVSRFINDDKSSEIYR